MNVFGRWNLFYLVLPPSANTISICLWLIILLTLVGPPFSLLFFSYFSAVFIYLPFLNSVHFSKLLNTFKFKLFSVTYLENVWVMYVAILGNIHCKVCKIQSLSLVYFMRRSHDLLFLCLLYKFWIKLVLY